MPDIHYVCLSDMHLGEEDSLLTKLKTATYDIDPASASPVMQHLVECLRDLISKNENKRKPTLILNGDILELALATTNQAAMVFERFMELTMPPDGELFERIIYIPGNHDHHIWELARETQYVNYITNLSPGKHLNAPWHATNIFVEDDPNPVPSYFLTRLVKRYAHLRDFVITTAYPNFGLFREEGQKCVIFHHGHFIESLYQLMTTFSNLLFPERVVPRQVWDIEAENFAWIDFFWSTLGRSGQVGQHIELIYEKMRDREQFKKLIEPLADSITKKLIEKWRWLWPCKMIVGRSMKGLFNIAVDRAISRERTQPDSLLSEEAKDGLQVYVSKPLKEQILIERKKNMPYDVTFVFGHTHKPFQEDMNFEGYPQWVSVYNSGGWVVDSVNPHPLHGGAVVLVDEHLNTVLLRMYNEDADPAKYLVRVEEAIHTGEENTPLYHKIRDLVRASEDPWKAFSAIVSQEVRVRAQYLQTRIEQSR